MIASYLSAERDLGRIAADADVDTLAPTLIGAGHVLFAGRDGVLPDAEEVRKVVATVLAGADPEPPCRCADDLLLHSPDPVGYPDQHGIPGSRAGAWSASGRPKN